MGIRRCLCDKDFCRYVLSTALTLIRCVHKFDQYITTYIIRLTIMISVIQRIIFVVLAAK